MPMVEMAPTEQTAVARNISQDVEHVGFNVPCTAGSVSAAGAHDVRLSLGEDLISAGARLQRPGLLLDQ